ncbi:MAG: hypothetical protein AAF329_22440 [Cyanobacteria bacterium P01_A01_bin.17]
MHDQPFAITRQNYPVNMENTLPIQIQPINQHHNQEVLPLCQPHDIGHSGAIAYPSQQWQSSSKQFPLLITVFLSGALLGAVVGGLFVFAIVPRNPPPIINNPPADIINPDCRLFCGN